MNLQIMIEAVVLHSLMQYMLQGNAVLHYMLVDVVRGIAISTLLSIIHLLLALKYTPSCLL